ncbi:hypothetical protein [Phenylobacterium sp. J367]|uniref:hypothetical protein n=1 Tax=Phenylobacterium sp. J367 TaxID=2898435 RepID=UPI002150EE46|nr:hypothetical protein [Phenylobacterium sp. J367]MCR5878420.1 hypothetical protein [Phenylobacterium sp. J367]
MKSRIPRLMLIFVGVFAVLCIGVAVWQVGWVMPMKKCSAAHKWWDHSERVCATPILVSDITGRVITDEKALAEAKKAIGRPPAPAAAPAQK